MEPKKAMRPQWTCLFYFHSGSYILYSGSYILYNVYSVDVDYCGRQEIKQRGSCAACPILLWSLACSLLEDAYEVGWVVESNLVGNLFAWRILCDEHELRFLYFLFVDVLQRRCS